MAKASNPIMDKVQDIGNQIGQAATNAIKEVKSATENVTNRASEMVSDATARAEQASAYMKNAGSYVKDQAEYASMALGEQLAAAGDASNYVAENLKFAGNYLETEGLEGMTADIVTLIKRNPLTSVVVGVCVGFCLGRTIHMRH